MTQATNRLFIPEIGTQLVLAKDWTFKLVDEDRNNALMAYFKWKPVYKDHYGRWNKPQTLDVTIPAGAVLKVDRIYIRKGYSGYSSVSFWLKAPDLPKGDPRRLLYPKTGKRFFARLDDVNNIEFSAILETAG